MKQSTLLKAALIGTMRVKPALGSAPHATLQAAWQKLETHPEAAKAVLQAAAIENALWIAGVEPIQVPQPTPSKPEVKQYVPAAAASSAMDLLQSQYKPFIAEWISITHDSGFIATPRLLPGLLDMGNSQQHLRASIADIVGMRGRWIAEQTGKWPWLIDETACDESMWLSGTLAERCAWLEHVMQNNPHNAAEAIEQSWPGDSPDTREAFTRLATRFPNAAHEKWLQQWAVVDRRQRIRHFAVRTLMQIPESGFRQRSLQRVKELISTQKKLLRENQLNCQPPTQYQSDWEQDGVREKPPVGTGEKAFWMMQLLSVVPLRDWPTLLDHDDPFSLTLDADWSDLVVKAWCAAAVIHPDANSLEGLLTRLSRTSDETVQLSAISTLLGAINLSEAADLLESLPLKDAVRFGLVLKCQPQLNAERHPGLQKLLVKYMCNETKLSKTDAVAIASCCASSEISNVLVEIGKLEKLSAVAEEFAQALEYRQSYLKHFTQRAPSESGFDT